MNNKEKFLFKCKKKSLQKTLASICNIIPKKSPNALISNVKIEKQNNKLMFMGTDLNTFIFKEQEYELIDEFTFYLLDGHLLYEIIKKMTGENISFFYLNNFVVVKDMDSQFSLKYSLDLFPSRNLDNFIKIGYIKSSIIEKLLNEGLITIKEDSFKLGSNYELNLNKKEILFLAKDRIRLSLSSIILTDYLEENNVSLHISYKNLKDLLNMCKEEQDILFKYIPGKECLFISNDNILLCKMNFVSNNNIQKYLELCNTDNFNFFIYNLANFKSTIKNLSIIKSDVNPIVNLIFNHNLLTLNVFNPNSGKAEKTLNGTGNIEGNIRINIEYLLDSLSICTEQNICLFYKKDKALIIKCGGTHLISPLSSF